MVELSVSFSAAAAGTTAQADEGRGPREVSMHYSALTWESYGSTLSVVTRECGDIR